MNTNELTYYNNPDYVLKTKYIPKPSLIGMGLEAALGIISELTEDAYYPVARFNPDVYGIGIDDYTQTVYVKRELLEATWTLSKDYMFSRISSDGLLLNVKTPQGRIYQSLIKVKKSFEYEGLSCNSDMRECSIKVNLNKFMYGHNTNNISHIPTLHEAAAVFNTAIKEQYGLEITNDNKLDSIDINLNFMIEKDYDLITHFHKFCNYAKEGSSSFESEKLRDHSISFKYCQHKIKMYDKGLELSDKQGHCLEVADGMQLIRLEVTIPKKILRKIDGLNLDKGLDKFNQMDLNNLKRYALMILLNSYNYNIGELVAFEPNRRDELGKDGFVFTCFEAMREWYRLKSSDPVKADNSYSKYKNTIKKKHPETFMRLSAIREYKGIISKLVRELAMDLDQPIKTRKKK